MSEDTGFDIWCGLDVGKAGHHACALNNAGKKVFDKALPQDQARLEELFATLTARGRVLVVVDQPNTIGALPISVARSMGITVAYLPGLAMRRIADLHPGNAKTDARDAFIIADAARTMPHTLRRVDVGEEAVAELKVLVGFDDDLAAEATRVSNRIRGLLTQFHPPWSVSWARRRPPRPGSPYSSSSADRRASPRLALPGVPESWPRPTLAARKPSPTRSRRLCPSRPWSWQALPPANKSCHAWRPRCAPRSLNALSWLPRSRRCSMLTLLPRS